MLNVITVTLNPALDETSKVDGFKLNQVNRIKEIRQDPGGHGINVAAYLGGSGLKTGASGFLGQENTMLFRKLFSNLDIQDLFVNVPGATRINLKVIDEENDTTTDISRPGFSVTNGNLWELEDTLFFEKRAEWYVLAGSTPPGIPDDIYAKWVDKAHTFGIRVAILASGKLLVNAVRATPDLIKLNHYELGDVVDKRLHEVGEILEHARKLIKGGINTVAVSMEGRGMVLVRDDGAIHAVPGKVDIVTPVGAGDALMAGLINGSIKGLNLEDTARMGTAYAMSALESVGPYMQGPDKIRQYTDSITTSIL